MAEVYTKHEVYMEMATESRLNLEAQRQYWEYRAIKAEAILDKIQERVSEALAFLESRYDA